MSPAIDNRAVANIEREDHTSLALDVDDHPIIPNPESEHSRERTCHRLQEVSRIVNPLNLPQLVDHTLLDTVIKSLHSLLGARSELNAPVRHLPFLSFSVADPQALTALRRETAGPWPPAAASVNIRRSAYSPFLPILNERTGRK